MSTESIARVLADAFTAGPWHLEELVARGGVALGRRWRWLRPLARRVLAAFDAAGGRPPTARVASFLLEDQRLRAACGRHDVGLGAAPWGEPVIWPSPGVAEGWSVAGVTTPAALAGRLGLTPGELDWFADHQSRLRRAPAGPLGHYVYLWRSKPAGRPRLIESPKPRLKALQRRVLREFLEPVPPHDAAHGFRRGRSVLTFAAPHAGQRVVLRMDLRDFFPSIPAPRVRALFRTLGYPEDVARALTGLCTNAVPGSAWDDSVCPLRGAERDRTRRLFGDPHLPQGAPTSPALANLCAYRLDRRLARLAESAGGRYSRYADDLAFSGGRDLERSAARFHVHACAVALEEGFEVNTRKTRVMRQGVRQRLAGVVVNRRPNAARDEYETLKAILHNCVRHGPDGQNREGHPDFRAHLAGRVAHLAWLNPQRGARLRALLDRIVW